MTVLPGQWGLPAIGMTGGPALSGGEALPGGEARSVRPARHGTIRVVGVVVPARNEEARLPRCLDALTTAVAALQDQVTTAPMVRLMVVDDGSTDSTAGIAHERPGVEVVSSAVGRVGAARRLGVSQLLSGLHRVGVAPGQVWIASTDADSAVPQDWLLTQLAHARAGVDLLLGTVRPDPAELAGGLLAAWRLRHLLEDGHPHVHGANLGVRGDSYLAAGGFPDVAAHEDVLLRDAVRRNGGWVVSTGTSPVLTSGRQSGRTPAGMAKYLRELGAGAGAGVGVGASDGGSVGSEGAAGRSRDRGSQPVISGAAATVLAGREISVQDTAGDAAATLQDAGPDSVGKVPPAEPSVLASLHTAGSSDAVGSVHGGAAQGGSGALHAAGPSDAVGTFQGGVSLHSGVGADDQGMLDDSESGSADGRTSAAG